MTKHGLELFVVVDSSGTKVATGFRSKPEAKAARNAKQTETKEGLPTGLAAKDHRNWSFRVSPGKDHLHMSPL